MTSPQIPAGKYRVGGMGVGGGFTLSRAEVEIKGADDVEDMSPKSMFLLSKSKPGDHGIITVEPAGDWQLYRLYSQGSPLDWDNDAMKAILELRERSAPIWIIKSVSEHDEFVISREGGYVKGGEVDKEFNSQAVRGSENEAVSFTFTPA